MSDWMCRKRKWTSEMLNLCKWWWWDGGCKDRADVTFQKKFLFQKYKTAMTCIAIEWKKEHLGTSGKVCTFLQNPLHQNPHQKNMNRLSPPLLSQWMLLPPQCCLCANCRFAGVPCSVFLPDFSFLDKVFFVSTGFIVHFLFFLETDRWLRVTKHFHFFFPAESYFLS